LFEIKNLEHIEMGLKFYDLKTSLIFSGVLGVLALVAYICDRKRCDKKFMEWAKRMIERR
jgi:hypothetical protein